MELRHKGYTRYPTCERKKEKAEVVRGRSQTAIHAWQCLGHPSWSFRENTTGRVVAPGDLMTRPSYVHSPSSGTRWPQAGRIPVDETNWRTWQSEAICQPQFLQQVPNGGVTSMSASEAITGLISDAILTLLLWTTFSKFPVLLLGYNRKQLESSRKGEAKIFLPLSLWWVGSLMAPWFQPLLENPALCSNQ